MVKTTRNKAKMKSIDSTHALTIIKSTGNKIEETGATSLSDALKSNTTLTKLYLWGEDKRDNTQMASINNTHVLTIIKSTGNNIEARGAMSLSDALKSNTTLTKLDLFGEGKRNNTQMASINNTHVLTIIKPSDNDIGVTGATSLSDALKSNTTLTKLYLRGEHKGNNTQMTSIKNPLFSPF